MVVREIVLASSAPEGQLVQAQSALSRIGVEAQSEIAPAQSEIAPAQSDIGHNGTDYHETSGSEAAEQQRKILRQQRKAKL